MNGTQVDIEKLMVELKEKAAKRRYSREAADFETVLDANDRCVRPFHLEDFKDELRDGFQDCYLEYDLPVMGKGKSLKKMIRRLYRFHMKPLWDKQNDVNIEIYSLLYQIRDYISQLERERAQKEQMMSRLETLCDEYEHRFHELEQAFKEKQV